MKFQVIDIVRGTTVDGPGFRTAIYLAGCSHGCPGCHNPQSHNPAGGRTMTLEEIMEIVREEDFDVTLTGGDPLFNPEKTERLAREVSLTGHTLWLYTGYTWEEIIASERLSVVLPYIEVVVDGRFVQSLRDPDLLFRGSSNQRLIAVTPSLQSATPVLYDK